MTDLSSPVAETAPSETALSETTLSEPAEQLFEVTRDAIQKFALAAGIAAAEHHDPVAALRAGHRDVVGPPYFFVSLGLAMEQVRPRAELSAGGIAVDDSLASRRVMAGETEVRWHGSIYAGDTIRVRRTFVAVEHKTGRSGSFDVYTFRREYLRGAELLIDETYSRIAR